MSEENKTGSILDGSAIDVVGKLSDVDNLDALKAEEISGKNRVGILKAIDAETKKRAKGADEELPASVTLESNYSYYDDEDNHHYWNEGQVVDSPEQVQALIERGAPLKQVEGE